MKLLFFILLFSAPLLSKAQAVQDLSQTESYQVLSGRKIHAIEIIPSKNVIFWLGSKAGLGDLYHAVVISQGADSIFEVNIPYSTYPIIWFNGLKGTPCTIHVFYEQ